MKFFERFKDNIFDSYYIWKYRIFKSSIIDVGNEIIAISTTSLENVCSEEWTLDIKINNNTQTAKCTIVKSYVNGVYISYIKIFDEISFTYNTTSGSLNSNYTYNFSTSNFLSPRKDLVVIVINRKAKNKRLTEFDTIDDAIKATMEYIHSINDEAKKLCRIK
jgi:hypothetical protein